MNWLTQTSLRWSRLRQHTITCRDENNMIKYPIYRFYELCVHSHVEMKSEHDDDMTRWWKWANKWTTADYIIILKQGQNQRVLLIKGNQSIMWLLIFHTFLSQSFQNEIEIFWPEFQSFGNKRNHNFLPV